MPLYEYQCPKCGRFELIRKFSDPALTACPTCGAEIQKLASAPAIQFKGTGWYITDYARKSGGGDGARSSSESGAKEGVQGLWLQGLWLQGLRRRGEGFRVQGLLQHSIQDRVQGHGYHWQRLLEIVPRAAIPRSSRYA